MTAPDRKFILTPLRQLCRCHAAQGRRRVQGIRGSAFVFCHRTNSPFTFSLTWRTILRSTDLFMQGGGDADFNHTLDLNSNVFQLWTIDVVWTDFPDSSSSPSGPMMPRRIQWNGNGIPELPECQPGPLCRSYAPRLVDDCAYLVLPFDFHVSEDIQTTVLKT